MSTLKTLPQFEMCSIIFGGIFFASLGYLTLSRKWHLLKASPLTWLLVITGIPLQQVLCYHAYFSCPPEEVDILIYMWPIISLGMMFLFMGKKLTIRHFVAGLIGILSVFVLSQEGAGLQYGLSLGHVSALICAVLWAIYSVFLPKCTKISIPLIGVSYGLGFVISLMCHMSFEQTVMPTSLEIGVLAYYMTFISVLPFWLWSVAMQGGDSVLLTTVSYVKPVISISMLIAAGITAPFLNLFISAGLVILAGVLSNDQISIKISARLLPQLKTS